MELKKLLDKFNLLPEDIRLNILKDIGVTSLNGAKVTLEDLFNIFFTNWKSCQEIYEGLCKEVEDAYTALIGASTPEYPRKAVWKNKDSDVNVTVTGELGNYKGTKYYKIAESISGLPETELEFGN